MNGLTIRPARANDAAAIRDLIHRVHINPMGLDWRRFLLAIDSSGTIRGCGQLKPHGGGLIELASIAVEPRYRKAGVARAIIESLILAAPRPLYLTCRSSLGSFYEKWGFRALQAEAMPPYFRRLSRVASLLSRISRGSETLLVMVLK
jgi:N-acetylglutamate synthase-like GNAT family acetyltransferase